MSACCSIVPVNAVMDTGVDWMFSETRRAVTTMVSVWIGESGLAEAFWSGVATAAAPLCGTGWTVAPGESGGVTVWAQAGAAIPAAIAARQP